MVNIISLQINGQNYTDFLSYNITKSIETMCGTFEATVSATDALGNFPIKPNDPIVIAVDDEPVITGYVDELEVSFNDNSHNIKVVGRDKTADFVDSTLDAKTFNPPIGFVDLLKKLLTLVGYVVVPSNKRIGLTVVSNQISIINDYGIIAPFTTAEGIQLKTSESAFNLIKRCAEKRQLILNSDGEGNIVIRSIGDEQTLTTLQNIKTDSSNNNIKNATVRYAWQDRFNKYTVKSMTTQGNTGGTFFPVDTSAPQISVTPQIGIAYDPDVRSTRKHTSIASSAMTASDCKKRAEWEANIKKTQGFTYSCEVFGFRQNLNEFQSLGFAGNPLWKPNQLVYVIDEFAGIDRELLIKSVTYNKDLTSGTTVKLELVDQQAYTTSIFEPLLRKKLDNVSGEVLFPS